jgi:hypothetical protein
MRMVEPHCKSSGVSFWPQRKFGHSDSMPYFLKKPGLNIGAEFGMAVVQAILIVLPMQPGVGLAGGNLGLEILMELEINVAWKKQVVGHSGVQWGWSQ